MHSKGTMALVFACTVPQARLARKFFGEDAIAAIAAIFDGSENPDPCAVTAALEPDAASARAYLVVMNGEVGFTLLLHHLQQVVDREIQPGDMIANQIVAFEGDIRPQGPTPNVVVFNKAEDTLSSGSTCRWHAWLKPTPGTARRPTGTTTATCSWSTRSLQGSLGLSPG